MLHALSFELSTSTTAATRLSEIVRCCGLLDVHADLTLLSLSMCVTSHSLSRSPLSDAATARSHSVSAPPPQATSTFIFGAIRKVLLR